jgi:hypothetical protein
MNDGFGVQSLGRDQREALAEIETHLVPENRQRAGAGAVFLERAVIADVPHQGQVLLHVR